MADFSMWGPEKSSSRLFENDQVARQLDTSRAQWLQQSARLQGAKATAAQEEAAALASAASAVKGTAGGKPVSLADQISRTATILVNSGAVVTGSKLANMASQWIFW